MLFPSGASPRLPYTSEGVSEAMREGYSIWIDEVSFSSFDIAQMRAPLQAPPLPTDVKNLKIRQFGITVSGEDGVWGVGCGV